MNWRKLRSMPLRELSGRLSQRLTQVVERCRAQRDTYLMSDDALWQELAIPLANRSAEALWDWHQDYQSSQFFLDRQSADELKQLISAAFPNLLPQVRTAADAVMKHQFCFFGTSVEYGDDIAWQADPISGTEWPQVFYADVPLTDLNYGDVKYVWELNRHQYFVDLGQAYWLTGEQAYADAFMELLGHWVKANPYNIGVNWTNALEPAYRVLSWIWTHEMCRDGITPTFHMTFLKSLYQHGRYIDAHLEVYSSPYNHLVGEATALLFIGTLFPEFNRASTWAERGRRVLDEHLEHQLHEDGFTVEQASFYHYATLGFYILAVLLRELNGKPVRKSIWERIERAIECSIYLTQPNGQIPRLGDCDDARPIGLSHRVLWDFREFHSIGAAHFQRSDFKSHAGEYAEDALWLLGVKGYDQFMALQTEPLAATSKAFDQSGYFLMRSDWSETATWGCFDCGPQSAGLDAGTVPSAAHGHADALSVLLTVGGEPMLVDAGHYTYNGEPAWRDYFRETRAHNTVVVDGANQAVHHGGMDWSNAARVVSEAWISNTDYDYACGRHEGYHRLAQPVTHRRAVVFRKSLYWLIIDELEGVGEHTIDSYLHFAPCEIKMRLDGLDAHFISGARLGVQLAGAAFTPDIFTMSGLDDPASGWIGTHYGGRVPAPVVRWRARLGMPQCWGMLLTWQTGDWQLDFDNEVFIVRGPLFEDRVILREHWPAAVSIELDGALAKFDDIPTRPLL